MGQRYALRDEQWERIKELLPGRAGTVGVIAKDNRLFVEAVLYRYRAGIPGRDLPERFGDWKNVHRRGSRWAASGVWKRIFRTLASDANNEYAMIDSTIVRAHQHSAGAKGGTQPARRSDKPACSSTPMRPTRRVGSSTRACSACPSFRRRFPAA